MQVERWNQEKDGPLSEASLRKKLEALGCDVSRYVYPPGASFPTHVHNVDKVDAVLSGQFRISLGSETVVLGPGDAVHVPKQAPHSAEVVGSTEVISLDGVKTRSHSGV